MDHPRVPDPAQERLHRVTFERITVERLRTVAVVALHVLVPVLALVGLCLPILALITE